MKIVVLTDSDSTSGFGHLRRVSTIIKDIQKTRKIEIDLWIEKSCNDKWSIQQLKKSKYIKIKYIEDIRKIAEEYKRASEKANNEILFIDSYKIKEKDIRELKVGNPKLKLIRLLDEPAKTYADLIIDYNPLAEEKWIKYGKEVKQNKSNYLLGSSYLPINRDKRATEDNKSDILICLGGSSQKRILHEITNSILKNRDIKAKIKVIAPEEDLIELRKIDNSRCIEYIKSVDLLIGYIENTKFFITSSSTQMYEASLLKIPSLCLELNRSQRNSRNLYEALGLWMYVPWEELDSIGKNIGKLINVVLTKRSYIDKMDWGSELVDGKGGLRIAEAIFNWLDDDLNFENKKSTTEVKERSEVSIRKINFHDLNRYLDLRNRVEVRNVMGRTSLIERLEHYIWWFSKRKLEAQIYQRGLNNEIIIWEKEINIDSQNYLIGGWFGSKYSRALLDAFELITKQIKTCDVLYPNHTWLAIINKKNHSVIEMNSLLGFKEVDLSTDLSLKRIFQLAFNIHELDNFKAFTRVNNVK